MVKEALTLRAVQKCIKTLSTRRELLRTMLMMLVAEHLRGCVVVLSSSRERRLFSTSSWSRRGKKDGFHRLKRSIGRLIVGNALRLCCVVAQKIIMVGREVKNRWKVGGVVYFPGNPSAKPTPLCLHSLAEETSPYRGHLHAKTRPTTRESVDDINRRVELLLNYSLAIKT